MADLLELSEHILLLKLMNATRSNIYIVREPDGDTLVDPGPVGTAPVILGLDRRGEVRLQRIVVTHAHPAHAGSVARVVRGTGVRTYVHALDARFLDGREPPLLPRGRRGQLIAALGRVVELCPPVFRLEELTDGVAIGDLTPLATPGHTPGHVCLLHKKDGALLLGDAMMVDDGRLALPPPSLSEDPARARSSLSALRGLAVEHLLPGHGAPILGGGQRRIDQFLDELGLA
jgi:glyoxylase-like metal-dependent hydrolase (beta-lactamase superfamily II)